MASPSPTPTPLTSPVSTSSPIVPAASRTAYISTTIASLIGCTIPILALAYLWALCWTHRYARAHPRPLNKVSGVRLQRYAPVVYVFTVVSSLAEVALSAWLLLQYRFHRNYPNTQTLVGTRLLLFCACWTFLTAGAYTVLFLHPVWSRHPIASVGAQTIWVFATWLLWAVGAGMVDAALPAVLVKGRCDDIVYCGQVQALFAVAVLEVLALTVGMGTLIWLAWQSVREVLKRETP